MLIVLIIPAPAPSPPPTPKYVKITAKGFRERSSAFDLKAVLDDFVRFLDRQKRAAEISAVEVRGGRYRPVLLIFFVSLDLVVFLLLFSRSIEFVVVLQGAGHPDRRPFLAFLFLLAPFFFVPLPPSLPPTEPFDPTFYWWS